MADFISKKSFLIVGVIVIILALLPVIYNASYDMGRNAAKRDILRISGEAGDSSHNK